MCYRHPLYPRTQKPHKLTIEEYENKFSQFEQECIDNNTLVETQLPELLKDFYSLEISCIYDYNLPLLFHLLSSERRKKLFHIDTNEHNQFFNGPIVLTRTLATMIVTGDYTPDEIEKILQSVYDFYPKIYTTKNHRFCYIKTKQYDEEKSFEEFKEFILNDTENVLDALRGWNVKENIPQLPIVCESCNMRYANINSYNKHKTKDNYPLCAERKKYLKA